MQSNRLADICVLACRAGWRIEFYPDHCGPGKNHNQRKINDEDPQQQMSDFSSLLMTQTVRVKRMPHHTLLAFVVEQPGDSAGPWERKAG